MATALPDFSTPDGATLVITPAGDSAITIVDPVEIGTFNRTRIKIQWSSVSQTKKRTATGKKEPVDLPVTAVYYGTEYDGLSAACANNKFCTAVLTKPKDIKTTDDTGKTVTLEGQIQAITNPAYNQETRQLEYAFVFVVDSYAVADVID
jgi:hypothetical protein